MAILKLLNSKFAARRKLPGIKDHQEYGDETKEPVSETQRDIHMGRHGARLLFPEIRKHRIAQVPKAPKCPRKG
jgi:hypothetical protein